MAMLVWLTHNYQCIIRDPNPNPNDENSKTLMRYHFKISDDKTHDSYFVQHCLFLHWEDTMNGGFKPKQHWI
jgi:hypothetical protein